MTYKVHIAGEPRDGVQRQRLDQQMTYKIENTLGDVIAGPYATRSQATKALKPLKAEARKYQAVKLMGLHIVSGTYPRKNPSKALAEVKSLVEDSGYSRADAIRIVRAGGL